MALATVALVAFAALVTDGAMALFTDQQTVGGNTFSTASSFGSGCDTIIVTADADAYVDNGAKTTNYGTLTYTRSAGGADQHRAFIHFTLPALGDCTLAGATLKLYASTGSTDGVARNVQAYRAAAAWSESTVTWNTQPATTGTATTVAAISGLTAFDVTTAVTGMYGGTTGDSSFLVRYETETGGGGHRWYTNWTSRESATNKPILELALSPTGRTPGV